MTFLSPEGDEFEQRRAQIAAIAHEQRLRHDRFVSDLTKEQLKTFIEMLQCFDGETGTGYVNFMMGRAATIMEIKHNCCPGCGEDHFSVAALDDLREEMGLPVPNGKPTPKVQPERDAAMTEYGMIAIDGQLQCEGCGLHSVSMEDRMLRPPKMDGCSGCQQKSAFG